MPKTNFVFLVTHIGKDAPANGKSVNSVKSLGSKLIAIQIFPKDLLTLDP